MTEADDQIGSRERRWGDDDVLIGIRVAERGENLAAALCGKYMAALGADVEIPAEPRFEGAPSAHVDGRNVLSLYLDRGKRRSGEAGEVDVVLNAVLDAP